MSTKLQNKQFFYTIHDNIFNHISINKNTSILLPHVCNNIDLFGGGFAAAIGSKYPIVKENYHLLGKSFLGKNPGHTQFITVEQNKQYNSYPCTII